MTVDLASAIAAPVEAYMTALNSGDIDAITSLFTDDGAFMANEAPTAAGADEIRVAYAHACALSHTAVTSTSMTSSSAMAWLLLDATPRVR